MENETGFHQWSLTPPDPEDYRATAVADSTSSNPAPLYRPIEVPNNDTNRPTTAGYVNGGLSINSRPRLPEPSERGEGPVSLEVDFDSKVTDAYEKLNDARQGYQLARSASYQYSPERVQNEMNPMYKGVQNTAKQERRQACRTCILHTCLAILIVTNVLALLLGGFNLANTFNVGMITSGSPSGTVSSTDPAAASSTDQSVQIMIQQLQMNLTAIHTNFSNFNSMHSANFSNVMTHLSELQEIVETLISATNLTAALNVTTPAVPRTTPTTSTPTSAPPLSIPLYENCSITFITSCSTGFQGTDDYTYCKTTPRPVTGNGDSVVTEVFCSINNSQIKPVTSSLTYSDGMWSCVCHGIDLPNNIEATLMNFQCSMYARQCPSAISIPQN